MVPLIDGALGIALATLTDTISTSSSFAARRGEDVDVKRVMVGLVGRGGRVGGRQG